MSELIFLGSIAGLYFMLAISPGPNFLVITQAAVSRSRSRALSIAMGVSTASVVWAALAAGGLGLIMARFGEVQRVLQVLGGAYLFYIGVTIFRKAAIPLSVEAGRGTDERGALEAYRRGLLTNLSNPKTLAFFSGVFASLFTPGLAAFPGAAKLVNDSRKAANRIRYAEDELLAVAANRLNQIKPAPAHEHPWVAWLGKVLLGERAESIEVNGQELSALMMLAEATGAEQVIPNHPYRVRVAYYKNLYRLAVQRRKDAERRAPRSLEDKLR